MAIALTCQECGRRYGFGYEGRPDLTVQRAPDDDCPCCKNFALLRDQSRPNPITQPPRAQAPDAEQRISTAQQSVSILDREPSAGMRFAVITSVITMFASSVLAIFVLGPLQIALVGEALRSFGVPWWASIPIAPIVSIVPLVGSTVGAFGGPAFGVSPIISLGFMLLPGRKQFVRYVLSRGKRTTPHAQKD